MCPLGFRPGGGHDAGYMSIEALGARPGGVHDVGYMSIEALGARPGGGHDVYLQATDLEVGMTWGMCLYRL